MRLARVIAAVLLCGIFGGFINAYLTDNGFTFPETDQGVWRPGVLGNIMIGAFAAFILWGTQTPATQQNELAVQQMAAAALAGVGGSRVITAEVDKRVLTDAANQARATIMALERQPVTPHILVKPFEISRDIGQLTRNAP